MALGKELDAYHKFLEDKGRANEYSGQYILIQGEEVFGFYSSFEGALQMGYQKFGLEPFLVKQVTWMAQARFVSRPIEPCHTSHERWKRDACQEW